MEEQTPASDSPSPPPKDGKAPPKSERDKRCDLYSSGQPGKPPCERCIREQHECVLGGSRRGGRRVKKVTQDSNPTNAPPSSTQSVQIPPLQSRPPQSEAEPRSLDWPASDRESRVLPPLPPVPRLHSSSSGAKLTVDSTLAHHDLQNPADALEFLAHVAGRDSDSNHLPPMYGYGRSSRAPPNNGVMAEKGRGSQHHINYPPLTRGYVSFEMIQTLLPRYRDKYHQFFPLANPAVFDINQLPTIAAKEPHLLAAVLTIASKDEKSFWKIHDACSSHMQELISNLVYTGSGTVEAVEALLILAEWVPRRPSSTFADAVGKGEEDNVAWSFVGIAIRMGYLLGIDRTGFVVDSEPPTAELDRKRLAWAACYMSDRQISVRIGKAFWSRGPGPMTAPRAESFPSLQRRHSNDDDFAAIFQANLELTQLFSNAHDVLYATKSRSNQLNYGGEYVKYIDDFRAALWNWHSNWGIFSCSPALKASLILSYEYLRLYVNAFAYQATLNRLAAQMQANGQQKNPFGSDVAATPDARFIYDSIDAAKNLLSHFNSFVDPCETFRYMPLRYYLYVIYSATFLYKAKATGVMAGDSRGSIKRLITDTIDRLQKASACTNDVGDRYSRLIKLLWRKPPAQPGRGGVESTDITRPGTALGQSRGSQMAQGSNMPPEQPMYDPAAGNSYQPNINTFSWLDLPAVGEFALNNNESIAGSIDRALDRFDDTVSPDGFGGFEADMLVPQCLPWMDGGASNIVF